MSVHTDLAVEIAHQLNPQLVPRYIALTSRRYVMDTPEESEILVGEIYPDVGVIKQGSPPVDRGAVATVAAPLQLATIIRTPVPHITVEIRDIAKRQLVTVIEVLSPTNKRGDGYKEYIDKREQIIRSTAHLVEIDLLRKGSRVPMRGTLPSVPYFVFIGRRERRLATDVWPITLDQPLPEIPVPLLAGDADAKLNLQMAVSNVYDASALKYVIDYARNPEVALTLEQASWVDEYLRAAGLRT